MTPPGGTAVYVSYGIGRLDLGWIPEDAEVIVVHNDGSLDPRSVVRPRVRHLFSPGNVGFGAGVNLALAQVTTDRVVVCNPDTELRPEHWSALVDAGPDEVVTVPLVGGDGRPTSLVNRYPTPASLSLTAWRVGRWLPRGGRARRWAARAGGRWARAHAESLEMRPGSFPLTEFWVSGAVFSVATHRVRAVGGFDPGYFLYLEDLDLAARLASRYPAMRVRVAGTRPGVHQVGGSAAAAQVSTERHYVASARRYAGGRRGPAWRAAGAAIATRGVWLCARGRW